MIQTQRQKAWKVDFDGEEMKKPMIDKKEKGKI